MTEQMILGVEVETFSEREKFLVQCLREHYTIERDIREAEEHARGDNLPYEPSVTAAVSRRRTDTERLAIRREVYIEAARECLPTLKHRKRVIEQALEDLKRYYPEWWTILHYKYSERRTS